MVDGLLVSSTHSPGLYGRNGKRAFQNFLIPPQIVDLQNIAGKIWQQIMELE